jgi:hypothetical protein
MYCKLFLTFFICFKIGVKFCVFYILIEVFQNYIFALIITLFTSHFESKRGQTAQYIVKIILIYIFIKCLRFEFGIQQQVSIIKLLNSRHSSAQSRSNQPSQC